MREPVAPVPRPALPPSLETVRKQLQTWRKKGRTGRRIPTVLWGAAVELCRDHSISKVSRVLRLDYDGLKKRVHETKEVGLSSERGFVKLDLGAPMISSPEWRVEMEAPNGARMTLCLKGGPRDLDPLELSRAFWSQGR